MQIYFENKVIKRFLQRIFGTLCILMSVLLGTNNQSIVSGGCYCHPQDVSRHISQCPRSDQPSRVFSAAKYDQKLDKSTNNITKTDDRK